ncbi:transporter [archaeon]|nr:transporter [archaeon]
MQKIEYIYLHAYFALFSITALISKHAASFKFNDIEFWLLYGIVILILGMCAFFWQKLLNRFPLSVAYSNRPIIFFWVMLWALLIFEETITLQNIAGMAVIIYGITWMVKK